MSGLKNGVNSANAERIQAVPFYAELKLHVERVPRLSGVAGCTLCIRTIQLTILTVYTILLHSKLHHCVSTPHSTTHHTQSPSSSAIPSKSRTILPSRTRAASALPHRCCCYLRLPSPLPRKVKQSGRTQPAAILTPCQRGIQFSQLPCIAPLLAIFSALFLLLLRYSLSGHQEAMERQHVLRSNRAPVHILSSHLPPGRCPPAHCGAHLRRRRS